jgi:hypothetical protein
MQRSQQRIAIRAFDAEAQRFERIAIETQIECAATRNPGFDRPGGR